jgi:hypothetical protein
LIQAFPCESGLLKFPKTPAMVDVFVPVSFAGAVGVDESVDEFLVGVADGHEGVDLIVSGHEDLLDFREGEVEAFLLEFSLEVVPLETAVSFVEEAFNSAEHVLGVAEILI